ncbi:MAG TPA: sterol desaturase family protein [Rhizomicrobium sp.]|nr:sterol desaturase family protein [Rhizomicrobium sp.]
MPRALIIAGFMAYTGILVAVWWAISGRLPDQFSLSLAGHVLTLRNIHDKLAGAGALVFLILPSAFWVECAVVGWEKSSFRALLTPTASIKTDIAFFVMEQLHVTGLVGRVLMLGLSIVSGVGLRDWLAHRTGFAIDLSAWPLLLQVALYFYVYSFFDYWAHRVGHTKWFWPLHRYHHSAEDFCVINGARVHPAGFVGIFCINIPMPLLGATPETMIWVNVVTSVLGFLIHSRIESGWGWVGRYVIQSPLHHRLHHKLDMREATGFFSMTPVWDHLFGGWSEQAERNVAVGVDTHYAQGFWLVPDLLRDYCDFWKGLVGRRALSPSEQITR